jgi:hypothetical protein
MESYHPSQVSLTSKKNKGLSAPMNRCVSVSCVDDFVERPPRHSLFPA